MAALTSGLKRLDESDDRMIGEAVACAHIPSLLAAIVQLTGDDGLLDEVPTPVYDFFGGDGQGNIPAEAQDKVRARAVEVLKDWRDGKREPQEVPEETVRKLMHFVAGAEIPERYIPFLLQELGIDGRPPRASAPTIEVPEDRKQAFRVLIIGAGMSGILAAIELQQAGIPYVIVDKNSDFGGTWLENSYPGCRVDVQNHLYCYSIEGKQSWEQYFSDRDVLYNYFRDVAEKYGLRKDTRFGTAVEEANWDEDSDTWSVRVRAPDGKTETITANAVISAVGQLNTPRYPDIEGVGSFGGPAFHSARWDHDVDLAGKRVAVIGTGASAFQFVPEIAPQTAETFVFQRTPPWLGPTPEYHDKVPEGKKWLLEHMPAYETWYRFYLFWLMTDGILDAVERDPDWDGDGRSVSELNEELRAALAEYMAAQAGDDQELADKIIPRYPPGGKRMLRDNGVWIAALKRDNVHLTDTPIRCITPTGVELEDGTRIDVDVLIYGTGFQASNFLSSFRVRGRDGVELHEKWQGDPRAYLGMTVPGFPNLFCLYGPNTNIVVNGSIIFFTECSMHYVMGCLKLLLENGYADLECRQDVHDQYNRKVDEANAKMAWGAPQVSSWYKNARGRVTQNWPYRLVDYWNATREPDPDDFVLE
ncbi:MAG TPA: NAD(P)/FAD-dependent oxidoreductase [Gammaproteobacteria bacterium]|nr:NAD(P)/FAD-dependent oxidoreductase [Gammaproteobacteria bacterium]